MFSLNLNINRPKINRERGYIWGTFNTLGEIYIYMEISNFCPTMLMAQFMRISFNNIGVYSEFPDSEPKRGVTCIQSGQYVY